MIKNIKYLLYQEPNIIRELLLIIDDDDCYYHTQEKHLFYTHDFKIFL